MIKIRQAHKSYGTKEARVEALRGVTLDIAAGEFVALMGPSGCGKSTLLHLLGGLDRITSGEIHLAQQPLHQLNDRGLTELRRSHVGIVFQFFNLLPTLSALENTQLPALLQGMSNASARERALRLLDQVGLTARASHHLHQLSGGEMQRIAVARALMMSPPVLLADEPTGNLDSEASVRMVQLLHTLGRQHGTTIVMVTHSREVAAQADRVIELRDGLVISENSKFEMGNSKF